MDHDREQRIRERAHVIWEREGRPEGREDEHRRLASDEIEREDSGSRVGALSETMEPELVSTGLIPTPADQFGTTRSGHQWKPAWPLTRSRSAVRRTHWRATAVSSSAKVSKCRLTIGSSRWTHSVSTG
jgi:hypothetical protein